MTPLSEFKKVYQEISLFATQDQVQNLKFKLDEAIKTEDLMTEIKKTKVLFETQIDKFIMKDDFGETFKVIDDNLENYRKVIYDQTKKVQKLKDEQKILIERVSRKAEITQVDLEHKKIWENFSKY